MLVAQGTLTAKDVRASHGKCSTVGLRVANLGHDRREKNGKMSTVVTQLLADYIVTAELEGDRLMGNARRATRTCSDRGDYAEIGRLRRSALCTVHLLQCIFFNTILDLQ